MAKKKIEIYIDVNNEKELDYILKHYNKNLICAQIYCSYFGYCTALDHLFIKTKLDWSDGLAILLRVQADEIESLKRFHGQSVPMFLFILNRKVINIFRGVDYIKFEVVIKSEIEFSKKHEEGSCFERLSYDIDEATPDEIEWFTVREVERQKAITAALSRKAERQADRKQHRAELLIPYLQHLNFVLYWPHATHAHPELYERWDQHNIIMVAREEIQLTKEVAEDVLYAGDAPMNEASMHKLLSAPALAICFRILDTDKNFVSLVRKILYEETAIAEASKSSVDQPPQKTAFDLYKSYSLSREEIWQKRREESMKRKELARISRARRLSEMQRLARQAIEDAVQARKMEREKRKLELLKAGNLDALRDLERSSPEMEEVTVPEELSDEEIEESNEEEDDNEYFPPPGLLIPGFYAPPNDIAKVNALTVLFPKIVLENVTPQPEFLPPHVLVLIDMIKSYRAIEILAKYKSAVIHMGIFKIATPYKAQHVAYSINQFNSLKLSINKDELKLAFMLSIKVDLPLLELMDLNPYHVSRDADAGEEECAAIFPVNYGDSYPEFEDFYFIA